MKRRKTSSKLSEALRQHYLSMTRTRGFTSILHGAVSAMVTSRVHSSIFRKLRSAAKKRMFTLYISKVDA